MKLKDLFIKEDEQMDLSLRSRLRPEDDISGKQSPDHSRKPVITLRHINRLKRMKYAQREEHEPRKVLLSLMYGAPSPEEEAV